MPTQTQPGFGIEAWGEDVVGLADPSADARWDRRHIDLFRRRRHHRRRIALSRSTDRSEDRPEWPCRAGCKADAPPRLEPFQAALSGTGAFGLLICTPLRLSGLVSGSLLDRGPLRLLIVETPFESLTGGTLDRQQPFDLRTLVLFSSELPFGCAAQRQLVFNSLAFVGQSLFFACQTLRLLGQLLFQALALLDRCGSTFRARTKFSTETVAFIEVFGRSEPGVFQLNP
ncbi:hypothetical protein [Ilumatobacter sp.]|uniref:hypothetical protein n=1 Tax=Ilumatobacter sp. TaxID=1967498 RepID=UPI003C67CB0B